MAFDIYGGTLLRGHCEVHPWVHEEFPCPVCIREDRDRKKAKAEEDAYWAAYADAEYAEMERRMIESLQGVDGDGI